MASCFHGTMTAASPSACARPGHGSAQGVRVGGVVVEGADGRRLVGALDGGHLELLLGRQQAREQGGDLGRRAVARHEAAFLHRAARGLEHLAHLVERGRVGRDGLVRVAQQQKVRPPEVAREHGQLGGGVVLHLVHHHVLRIRVAEARERHLQVEPLERREAVGLEEAHADAVDAQPVVVLHGGEGVGVAVGQVAQGERALLLLVGRRDELAEDAQLLVGLEGLQLVERLVGSWPSASGGSPGARASSSRMSVMRCGPAGMRPSLLGQLADLVGGDEALLVRRGCP